MKIFYSALWDCIGYHISSNQYETTIFGQKIMRTGALLAEIDGFPNSRSPDLGAQHVFRRRSTGFHYLAMAPPRPAAAWHCSHGTPRPPQPPPVAGGSHLDLLPPKRHPTAAAELAFRGSNSQRSTLAWRCRRRRHRDRWTPRRRFQVRSACPCGAADGPRPGQRPGTRGAGNSGRA